MARCQKGSQPRRYSQLQLVAAGTGSARAVLAQHQIHFSDPGALPGGEGSWIRKSCAQRGGTMPNLCPVLIRNAITQCVQSLFGQLLVLIVVLASSSSSTASSSGGIGIATSKVESVRS